MPCLKSSLFAISMTLVASGAFAQTDPKLTYSVTPELSPNEVTLSRGLTSTTPFIGRAAWRVKVRNGAANTLNRALFTAESIVVDANYTPTADVAPIEPVGPGVVIQVAGAGAGCALNASKLSCNFGDNALSPGEYSEFIVVAQSPTAGDKLKLRWSFGGGEGNSGPGSCCTVTRDTEYTTLTDAASLNSTVKTHVQSFIVKNVLNKVFTGIAGGSATEADPWATTADLGTGYAVLEDPSITYTKATIDEQDTSATSSGSCSALNKNQCWQSNIAVPDTTWTPASPLIISLERHSSIIKNGSKLSAYAQSIQYEKNGNTKTLLSCSAQGGPLPETPCVDICVERLLTSKTTPFVWQCTIKALDNGIYRIN